MHFCNSQSRSGGSCCTNILTLLSVTTAKKVWETSLGDDSARYQCTKSFAHMAKHNTPSMIVSLSLSPSHGNVQYPSSRVMETVSQNKVGKYIYLPIFPVMMICELHLPCIRSAI